MLKTRKRWISLLLTLAMLVAFCVPFVGTAAAAGTSYSSSEIARVQDDTENADLGTVLIEIDPLGTGTHEAWVSLPSDFDVNDVTVTTSVYTVTATATPNGTDGFKLTVTNSTGSSISDVDILIDFNDVDVPSGASGDIKATFDNIKGQLLDGSAVIAIVSGGAVSLAVTDSGNFSEDGGQVTMRLQETVAGSLNDDDTVDITLPDGFEWGTVTADGLWGDLDENDLEVTGEGTDKLKIGLKDGTTKSTSRSAFELVADINVSDEDEAEFGDVVAKVKGDYDATPSEITVGTYGDYGGTIEPKDATITAYAGMNEQDVSDIKIKEGVAGSLVNGRTVTLQLPSNARWVMVNNEYVNPDTDKSSLAINDSATDKDNGIKLTYQGLSGTDDRTLKLKVVADDGVGSTDAAELTIDDIQVALEAGVTGDLVAKVGGSAGLTGEITLAKVVSPVTVTAEKKDVQIGKFGQAAGDITITEVAAEAIDEEGTLTVTLPDDVEYDGDPDVTVTSGDLKIDDVDTDEDADGNDVLNITFKSDSSEASTIKISGIKYAINRVLPEGDIKVDVGGDAIVETNFQGYYDKTDNDGNAFEEDGNTPFFEDSSAAAKVANASCVTPADNTLTGTAVFKIGEASYTFNGATVAMDAAPYIKDGRTFVPVRFAANAVGVADANIIWDGAAGKVTVIKGDRVIQMTIGSNVMLVNGAAITMDAAPEIQNGRTMLPIRFLGQALGAEFVWDETAQTVTVTF